MIVDMGTENDLYEFALKKCLENSNYVVAIIPESFITTDKFKSRLDCVISLAYDDMFSDTDHPVCLALFWDTAQMRNYGMSPKNYLRNKFPNLVIGSPEEVVEIFWNLKEILNMFTKTQLLQDNYQKQQLLKKNKK
jgi:hypothetical protein